ncbi:nucleoid-associated protein [Flavobacterium psychroterrae]|uniref:Nucleoid-associated protein n=1 Tax=Flavobacterium psychroterrae TaxID=2133767 RepID=A0ABS5PDJ6_9FLAO|nr:nucleoid-associated protein [Flavobacterium psychroterrae]MBS7232186.1 nucleoid-associated protein [Flavobacterium psychroterrae]
MILDKIVIHELKKESESNKVELIFSDELLPNDDDSTALLIALSASYKSDKILYAVFDDSEGRYFPEKFNDYKDSTRQNQNFIDFTRQVIGNLETLISPVTFATGGYFIFAEYIENGNNFISVFLIRDVEGKILKKTKNSFAIQTVEYIDTKNLAMACRINENRINDREINYLSFIQLRQKEVSEYFKSWISIKQLESSAEYTKTLYTIISQIEPPKDPETNIEYDLQTFRDLVYNYVSKIPNKTVNIKDLSQYFYEDNDKVSNFANEKNLQIDTEFRFNGTQLKKFIKVEVNRDGINLKFSRGILNEKVRFSDHNPNQIIIESESFAKALRNQIND